MGMKPRVPANGHGQQTVDAYVAGLGEWQGEVVTKVRELVRSAAPRATESIKWAQPVYESNGPFAYIKAFSGHVNLGFWRGADLPDPKHLLQGTGGKMRHVKLTGVDDIDTTALTRMVKAAVALNAKHGNPAR
ncbi:MAG TPA: DUF1801 domain-containing protein [Kofleriaceae bacterium]|nr:DUF1801 domain-containing protein [Kofleriaceae bacterium]